jgi:hypothetical protein
MPQILSEGVVVHELSVVEINVGCPGDSGPGMPLGR